MIKNLISLLFLAAFSPAVFAQEPVIVSPEWLKQHLNDPGRVVLYTGFVIRADFDREHIEGSRFLWPDWLAPNTPESNLNATDLKTATRVLQELGINKDSRIVICHKGADITIAARMFMTLEHLGLEGRVSFLSGGIEAWKRAGFAVTSQSSNYEKGNFIATDNKKIVDKSYVLNALNGQSSVVVDARVKRFYDGDATGNPRDGHITGALNIPYPDMIDSLNRFKPADQLGMNFQKVLPGIEKEVVVYCFIGQTACVDYLAGRSLGYRVKVYDGSMQEWSRDASLPMEKTKKE
ncbi:MAG: sulfurtransferase [Chitinophagaceae bacterium]|nr:sulfurtransferase [Chitinophagaceae bacterium]MBL0056929.1 sulfurtransferase [Chitinophagaceae bacterium]